MSRRERERAGPGSFEQNKTAKHSSCTGRLQPSAMHGVAGVQLDCQCVTHPEAILSIDAWLGLKWAGAFIFQHHLDEEEGRTRRTGTEGAAT